MSLRLRVVLLFVSVAAVAGLLSSCGDSTGPTAESSDGSATDDTDTVANVDEGTSENRESPEPTDETTNTEDGDPEPTEPPRPVDPDGTETSGEAWNIDLKVRSELPVALRNAPTITTIKTADQPDETAEADEDDAVSRAQWFDGTLVHLRADGVTAYDSQGTELWNWVAPNNIDDLERDSAVRFEDQVMILSRSDLFEELVGLNLSTGEETVYGETSLGSIIGTTPTGVWGTNASGDFEGVDLSEPGQPLFEDDPNSILILQTAWHVDTNGPIGFSDEATVVAFDFDDGPDFVNELRWYDLNLGTTLHAPAPAVHQADVDMGDDEVYAVTVDDEAGTSELVTYDLDSGETRWRATVDGEAGFGAITPVNEGLVALTLDGTVVFDANSGEEVWREDDDLQADHRDSPFFENTPGTIVAISDDGYPHARDAATGELQWVTDERNSGTVIGTATAAYVADAGDAEISAYDLSTGELLWAVALEVDRLTSIDITDEGLAVTAGNELILLHA